MAKLLTAEQVARLDALELEPRWPITDDDKVSLRKYFPQEDLNSIKGLRQMLEELPPIGFAVEVGCYRGVSTECLAMYCDKLFAIDPWVDGTDLYEAFMRRMSPYDNVLVSRTPSPASARGFDNLSLDLVYIDGMHTRAEVEADIKAWLPKVKQGGYLAGHDYVDYRDSWMSKWIQVVPAVNATIGIPDKVFQDSSWLWQKK